MAKIKHTPTPWSFSKQIVIYREDFESTYAVYQISDTPQIPLAYTFTEDNANLIAAAPEMYEALKRAEIYTKRGLNANRSGAYEQIKAAIAKAEGQL